MTVDTFNKSVQIGREKMSTKTSAHRSVQVYDLTAHFINLKFLIAIKVKSINDDLFFEFHCRGRTCRPLASRKTVTKK